MGLWICYQIYICVYVYIYVYMYRYTVYIYTYGGFLSWWYLKTSQVMRPLGESEAKISRSPLGWMNHDDKNLDDHICMYICISYNKYIMYIHIYIYNVYIYIYTYTLQNQSIREHSHLWHWWNHRCFSHVGSGDDHGMITGWSTNQWGYSDYHWWYGI